MTYKEAYRRIFYFDTDENTLTRWKRRYTKDFESNLIMYNKHAYNSVEYGLFTEEIMKYHNALNVIDIELIRQRHCE